MKYVLVSSWHEICPAHGLNIHIIMVYVPQLMLYNLMLQLGYLMICLSFISEIIYYTPAALIDQRILRALFHVRNERESIIKY